MLDKLLISKNNAGSDSKRKGILFTTFMVVLSLFSMGMIYSLFSQNLAMGQDSLNISTLIAPPVIPQEKPPAPKPENAESQPEKQAVSQIITRKEIIQRITETPFIVPKTISTQKSTALARPNAPYRLDKTDSSGIVAANEGQTSNRGGSYNSGVGDDNGIAKIKKDPIEDEIKNTIPEPPPVIKPKKNPPLVTKGVINGQAKNLVMPAYPALAKTMGLRGKVTVQVMVDENGNVISASSLDGHKLLAPAALKAARATKFTPTFLGDQKVKVRGVIIYNFAL